MEIGCSRLIAYVVLGTIGLSMEVVLTIVSVMLFGAFLSWAAYSS
jgi:hypothetical protein